MACGLGLRLGSYLARAPTPTNTMRLATCVWHAHCLPLRQLIACLPALTPACLSVRLPALPALTPACPQNLVMVSNCTDLLAAVRGASEARPAVVLTASVSLASCWPADGVAVPPVSSLYLMGLPDQPIRLDLAGREDALQLVRCAWRQGVHVRARAPKAFRMEHWSEAVGSEQGPRLKRGQFRRCMSARELSGVLVVWIAKMYRLPHMLVAFGECATCCCRAP